MKLTEELEKLKYDLGILKEVNCPTEETKAFRKLLEEGKPLPEGVLQHNADDEPEYATFYRVEKTDLSPEELSQYIEYKRLKSLITIKNCVVFFTVLTIISLALGALAVLSSM